MSLQRRNVTVYLPYTFCERCPNAEIVKLSNQSVNGKDRAIRICEHQDICIKTVQMALDTIDKGEPLR